MRYTTLVTAVYISVMIIKDTIQTGLQKHCYHNIILDIILHIAHKLSLRVLHD